MIFLIRLGWTIVISGGWAPLAVFLLHVYAVLVMRLYVAWPNADIPMHFLGGLSIAYFFSGVFRRFEMAKNRTSRTVALELVLIGALTAAAALFWELFEFSVDQLCGTRTQPDLANTIQDMFLGVTGAFVLMLVRAFQLRANISDVVTVLYDWLDAR